MSREAPMELRFDPSSNANNNPGGVDNDPGVNSGVNSGVKWKRGGATLADARDMAHEAVADEFAHALRGGNGSSLLPPSFFLEEAAASPIEPPGSSNRLYLPSPIEPGWKMVSSGDYESGLDYEPGSEDVGYDAYDAGGFMGEDLRRQTREMTRYLEDALSNMRPRLDGQIPCPT